MGNEALVTLGTSDRGGKASRVAGVEAGVRASRAMLGIIARSVAPALEEVTLPQFRVLVLLETAGPLRVGVLALQLGVVVSTFSRSLDRLEDADWVARTQATEDRREVTVTISAKGSALVTDVTGRRVAALSSAFSALSDVDEGVLDAAFTAFADAVGEPSPKETLILGL